MATTLVDLLTRLPEGERELMEQLLHICKEQGCNPITVSANDLCCAMGYGQDDAGKKRLRASLRALIGHIYTAEDFNEGSICRRTRGQFVGEVSEKPCWGADASKGDSMLRIKLGSYLAEFFLPVSAANGERLIRFPIATNADNEAWGDHDPAASHAAHDPTLEPWASMSREQLLEAQSRVKTAAEFDMIQEFILDGMSTKELKVMNHAHALAVFLMNEFGTSGNDQAMFVCEVAGRVAKEITDGMPPIGPPQDCN